MTPDERIDALESRIAELQKEHAAKIDELLEFFERQTLLNETTVAWVRAQNDFFDKVREYLSSNAVKTLEDLRRLLN